MRKIILAVAISLDGKIEGPNGEFDWCFTDQDYGMNKFLAGIDTIFFGRKSYELVRRMDESGEYKDPYRHLNNFVFTNTLAEVTEGYSIISGNIGDQVRELKEKKGGKNIWLFGGTSLTTSLMNAGLIDELWLSFHPIILGPGKPLFEDLNGRFPLKLINSKTYSTGLISIKYRIHYPG